MAEVLENLLTGHFIFDDFELWLVSDSTDNFNDKANFITHFLNYVKEKCSWVITKEGKFSESPLKSSEKLKEELNKKKPLHSANSPRKNKEKLSASSQAQDRQKDEKSYFTTSPYKVPAAVWGNGHGSNMEFSSYDSHRVRHGEKYPLKAQCSAKKSLNFNCSTDLISDVTHGKKSQVLELNVNNFDAFPPLCAKDNDIKSHARKIQRRITPTPVQAFHKGSSNFGSSKFNILPEKVPNEVFNRTSYTERPSSDLQKEREMLKKTRNELSQLAVTTNNFNDLKAENVSPIKKLVKYIDPSPEEVSHKKELETFSSVYDILISNALVPNVTSELYFIFELLTSKVSSEDKPIDKSSIFCSFHNIIFFGVSVLSKVQNMLNLFDQSTLFSVSEIPFLHKFSLPLVNFLQACCSEKPEITSIQMTLNRVPFLLDEDSRQNFIDGKAFTNFRKQRDLFYELLRDWQQQPLNSVDQKFQENFSRKARQLINLGPNAVNLHHLARLFQNQLIASCLGFEVNEAYDELLSNIQQNFPGKLEKLYQRFMMPFSSGEPNPSPAFYGIQAFFCELIQATSSASLNQQLQDIFISKILDLNSVDIFSDAELSSLSILKEKYICILHTLRLLAKFLGYLYFLPYKVSEPLPASFLNNQLNTRKHSAPPIDILKLLKTSVENNRVILTAPWVVEYLSMIDPVGIKIPYVEETLSTLVSIYRGKYILSPDSLNFWFLRIMIGWLFDVLRYPYRSYSLFHFETLENNVKQGGLDSLTIIDKQLIHSCCPYLNEFKVLICNFLNGIKNDKKREIRKITPLSTTKPQISSSQKKHEIEVQLEENFFFLHPPSMKKTVEFISERIASKIINKIRSEVTDFKLQTIDFITTNETYKELLASKSNNKIKSFIDTSILTQYEKSQSKITRFIHVDSIKDIEHIMPYFFPDDLKPQVLKVCCKVSFRLAVDKITDWCDTNLIFVDMSKDIKNKLSHLSKGEDENMTMPDVSIYVLIGKLRKLIVKILSGLFISLNDHVVILSEILPIMDKQIGSSTKKLIAYLTVDLYISLIIHDTEKCCGEFHNKLLQMWSLCPKNYDLENYYIGIQNIKFLVAAKNFEFSCKIYILMLQDLINNNIFDLEKLKSYSAKLNSLQWEHSRAHEILQLISSTFLKSVAS